MYVSLHARTTITTRYAYKNMARTKTEYKYHLIALVDANVIFIKLRHKTRTEKSRTYVAAAAFALFIPGTDH